MTTARQRVVDDVDPAIKYGPNGWFVVNPSTLAGLGNFGPIWNGTSHATATANSTLSYAFNGTSMRVLGTIMVSTDSNNVTDPTWECAVDGIPISNPQPTFQFAENNWILCDQPRISPGSHVLTIQVQSKGRPFYLDDLVYTPLPGDTFDSAVLIYSNTDPGVSYSAQWTNFGGENATQTNGAQVALSFEGTSASLFGFVPTELPHDATTATYAIDGGTPVPFALNGLPKADSATQFNTIFFTTPLIPNGQHNLVVTHAGDDKHTPLVVGGFHVTNTSTSTLVSPSSSVPLSSPIPSAASTSKQSSAAAIAGGVIGGIVLLALAALLFVWCRRRQRRHALAAPLPMYDANSDAPRPSIHASSNTYAHAPAMSAASAYSRFGGGGRSDASRPSTTYPYIDRVAPPTTDASSYSGGARSDASRPSTTYPYVDRVAPSTTDASSYGGGTQWDVSRPSTIYPYIDRAAYEHASDTTSAPSRSHTHRLSGSSYYPATSTSHDLSTADSHPSNALGVSVRNAPPLPKPRRPPPLKLAREIAAAAAFVPPAREPGVNSSVVVLRHEDSGVRLRSPSPQEVVELPPGYSAD
ncbi:hypothetical protein B0H15DRAFT_933710 [Mycena belliarum]|uniref:Uncharacterized protein n=1 Tax=Mycena belliarum TaxID=1033014 RepID=A0AAD6TVD5_9AGAR|nr:hypothetical protein B0H15DRAFT_933710 [Mycena belliae]